MWILIYFPAIILLIQFYIHPSIISLVKFIYLRLSIYIGASWGSRNPESQQCILSWAVLQQFVGLFCISARQFSRAVSCSCVVLLQSFNWGAKVEHTLLEIHLKAEDFFLFSILKYFSIQYHIPVSGMSSLKNASENLSHNLQRNTYFKHFHSVSVFVWKCFKHLLCLHSYLLSHSSI